MKKIDIHALARPNILALTPYSSARDEFQGQASTYLDANESPWDTAFNRYPDPHHSALRSQLASMFHVSASQVFTGNGSDEVIDLLMRVFGRPGVDEVIIPQPTYGMYAVSAGIHDLKISSPSLTSDFNLDPEAVLRAVTPQTKLIFLCSPNNPSGNVLRPSAIRTILENFGGLVVVDEAYGDFTGQPGWIDSLDDYNHLVVMRTMSKAWGLASLRLGMCFANSDIIGLLDRVKPPYNLSGYVQHTAAQQLTTRAEAVEKQVATLVAERQKLSAALMGCPVVRHIYPSDANFLLVRVTDGRKAYEQLMHAGIIVRDRSSVVEGGNCLRITVGTPEENNRLIEVMKSL